MHKNLTHSTSQKALPLHSNNTGVIIFRERMTPKLFSCQIFVFWSHFRVKRFNSGVNIVGVGGGGGGGGGAFRV